MSAIAALINRPLVRSLGQLLVYVCAAVFLTYVVLQLKDFSEFRAERQRTTALVLDALREAQADRQAQQIVLDELTRTVWGDLEPRVEKQEKRPPAARVPSWQNWQQTMTDRVKRLEEWRLRHMSQEHN